MKPAARRAIWVYWRELRAPFLPASGLAVCLGASLVRYQTGRWDWPLVLACLFGVGALHAGANVLNDYGDHRSGNDATNTTFVRPFTGGSRLIQQGLLRPGAVLVYGLALLGLGTAVGLWLASRQGSGVLLFLAAGLAAGLGYSVPRIGWAANGAGEIVTGLAFGLLPVAGTCYLLGGAVPAEAILLALPVTLLIAAVLFINQFQDSPADAAAGKRHWVVRLGRRRAARVYVALIVLWMPLLLVGAAWRGLPDALGWALVPGILAPPAARLALRHYDHPAELAPANALTIALHHLVTAALCAILLLADRSPA